MRAVESSSIGAVGYDPDSRELAVQFKSSGRTYVYFDVEERRYRELLEADSIGGYFNREIRPHHRFEERSAGLGGAG
jgi:hypothetical protein